MKGVAMLLIVFFALSLVVAMFAYPNNPDLDPNKTQGLLIFSRNGEFINGTQTWEITQIDPAFFSYLSNYTLVKLEISGKVSLSEGSVYINNHYVGIADTSRELNEWDVPLNFCNVTTIIKVISDGWNVESVSLLFMVKFSEIRPWWKQNIIIILIASIAEIGILIILARIIVKWIKRCNGESSQQFSMGKSYSEVSSDVTNKSF